jgi:hypothetical protein
MHREQPPVQPPLLQVGQVEQELLVIVQTVGQVVYVEGEVVVLRERALRVLVHADN